MKNPVVKTLATLPRDVQTIFCYSEESLRMKLQVFRRDMALQGKQVKMARKGNRVFCLNPPRVWVLVEERKEA